MTRGLTPIQPHLVSFSLMYAGPFFVLPRPKVYNPSILALAAPSAENNSFPPDFYMSGYFSSKEGLKKTFLERPSLTALFSTSRSPQYFLAHCSIFFTALLQSKIIHIYLFTCLLSVSSNENISSMKVEMLSG